LAAGGDVEGKLVKVGTAGGEVGVEEGVNNELVHAIVDTNKIENIRNKYLRFIFLPFVLASNELAP
jgi:hypothetical protein